TVPPRWSTRDVLLVSVTASVQHRRLPIVNHGKEARLSALKLSSPYRRSTICSLKPNEASSTWTSRDRNADRAGWRIPSRPDHSLARQIPMRMEEQIGAGGQSHAATVLPKPRGPCARYQRPDGELVGLLVPARRRRGCSPTVEV